MEKEEYQVYSPLATVVTLRRIWTEGGTLHKFYDDELLGTIGTETLESQVKSGIEKQAGNDEGPMGSLLRTLSSA